MAKCGLYATWHRFCFPQPFSALLYTVLESTGESISPSPGHSRLALLLATKTLISGRDWKLKTENDLGSGLGESPSIFYSDSVILFIII